jgi:hypothetical protein
MYNVKRNECDCHPQTCTCNDWAVYDDKDKKFATFFDKITAETAENAMNNTK